MSLGTYVANECMKMFDIVMYPKAQGGLPVYVVFDKTRNPPVQIFRALHEDMALEFAMRQTRARLVDQLVLKL